MRWAAILWLAVAAAASARAEPPASLCVFGMPAGGGVIARSGGNMIFGNLDFSAANRGNFPSSDLEVMACSSRPEDCLYHLRGGQGSDPQVCQCLASRCVETLASCQTHCHQGGGAAQKACRDACIEQSNSCGAGCIAEIGVPLQRRTACSYKIGDVAGNDPRVCACVRTQCRSGSGGLFAACASRCAAGGGGPIEEKAVGKPATRAPAPGGGVTVLRGRK
jgi:hypothetical protein